MGNIEKLKDYLYCIGVGENIYTNDNVDEQFNNIANILLKKCVIKVGVKRYRMLEIEFYLFSKKHLDIIAYPRTNMEGGEWFFHPSGVDLCFKSYCKMEQNRYILDEDNEFGGILIRSIVEVDSSMNPIGNNVINGPIKCMDALFKSFGAFDDNRSLNQIASIIESETEGIDNLVSVVRHIPVEDDTNKIRSIFSENYKIKRTEQDDKEIIRWKNHLRDYRLNHKWRYFIDGEYYKGYDANPKKKENSK